MKRWQAGDRFAPFIGYSYESPEPMRRFLSSKRFQLLQTIWSRHPKSVYELAKMSGRPRMAVVADLKELQWLKLVTFRRARYRGRRVKTPLVPYDRIRIDIDLKQAEVPEKTHKT